MDIKVLVQEGAEIAQPFLENVLQKPEKTPGQKAIRKTFKGTAHLARLLPTGSVLTFQILSPILTHEGQCRSVTSQTLTSGLLAVCGLACFLLCFTDSFRDARGKVRYGMVTFKGLWIIDATVELSPEEAAKYKLKFIDVLHAFMSILVFAAVSLFDKNVVKCFFPAPTDEAKDLLIVVPATIGVLCSILFLAFPSKRHGIGFPLSRN
ncbi:PREDICTED: uncharacterized protein LOC105139057 [Populus euphratica]|uniref:Uncharacterized protein LOC105139057 n=1 Tax=Populus euphratica TaxID=75702 RepID=A0AAJ6Y6A0_POPEU|nr:PREDICTED: uncharacterized protein LOC105139057 [Populus euphratica]